MQKPPVIVFTPVPGRPRRDAWSPCLQRQFVTLLASGVGVAQAARLLGKNRQAAYALRRRHGAESFAQAWDAAVAAARPPATEPSAPFAAAAEAAAEHGHGQIRAAGSHMAARAAFTAMVDAMYGVAAPRESDSVRRPSASDARRRFRRLAGGPVAFDDAPLKREPC